MMTCIFVLQKALLFRLRNTLGEILQITAPDSLRRCYIDILSCLTACPIFVQY